MSASQESPEPSLNGPRDLLLSALPPLKAALKVLRSPTPLKTLTQEKHSWYGLPVALCLIMVFAILLILANEGAPFVDPWTSLWTNKFELNVTPVLNWPVLLRCAGYVISACAISYGGSILAGFQLNEGSSANRQKAIRLAGYASLAAASIYVVILLVIFALGWILYFLKFRIFIFGWMTIAAVALLPITTWGISKVFRRTTLPRSSSFLPPLTISMTTITMCALGAIFVMDGLADASRKQGRAVNSARNNPTAAVVQTCNKLATDVVCAVTLFPTKWQDYELIGDWKLGTILSTNSGHQARFYWHPVKEADHEFALVNVESRKDITIEIRIATNIVCIHGDTNITKDDQFFAVQGRVRGEQRNAPQEMRVRIDNGEPSFENIIKQVCSSKVSA